MAYATYMKGFNVGIGKEVIANHPTKGFAPRASLGSEASLR